jgi:hypothetical protein
VPSDLTSQLLAITAEEEEDSVDAVEEVALAAEVVDVEEDSVAVAEETVVVVAEAEDAVEEAVVVLDSEVAVEAHLLPERRLHSRLLLSRYLLRELWALRACGSEGFFTLSLWAQCCVYFNFIMSEGYAGAHCFILEDVPVRSEGFNAALWGAFIVCPR